MSGRTPAETEALKALLVPMLEAGLSRGQIARTPEIMALGLSKDAIIGFCGRHLPQYSPGSPIHPKGPPKPRRVRRAEVVWVEPVYVPPPDRCCWPLNDEKPFRFCEVLLAPEERAKGQSYCRVHRGIGTISRADIAARSGAVAA